MIDGSLHQRVPRYYCEVYRRQYFSRSNYNVHLCTACHKRMDTDRSTSPKVLPDQFDPNGCCCICNKVSQKRKYYRIHLKSAHKMKLTPLIPKPDFSITPDPNNSSNHCDSYNRTFDTITAYRRHLKNVHKIIIRRWDKVDILPDVDDTNFYCKACQVKCKTSKIYRTHLRNIHKMKLTPRIRQPIYDPTISAAELQNPSNTSCVICKLKLSSKQLYRQHMLNIHLTERKTPINTIKSISNPNIEPDPMIPIFTARLVKKKVRKQK